MKLSNEMIVLGHPFLFHFRVSSLKKTQLHCLCKQVTRYVFAGVICDRLEGIN